MRHGGLTHSLSAALCCAAALAAAVLIRAAPAEASLARGGAGDVGAITDCAHAYGPGTVGAAVAAGGSWAFACSGTVTFQPSDPELTVSQNVSIDASGHQVTLDGSDSSARTARIFDVKSGSLTLSSGTSGDLILSGGSVVGLAGADGLPGAGGTDGQAGQSGGQAGTGGTSGAAAQAPVPLGPSGTAQGGCMYIASGTSVTLSAVSIANCTATGGKGGNGAQGGSGGNGGAGANQGNQGSGDGGDGGPGGNGGDGSPGAVGGAALGGAIYNAGALSIQGGRFDSNKAQGGTGGNGGEGGFGGSGGDGGSAEAKDARNGTGGPGSAAGNGAAAGSGGDAQGGAIYSTGQLSVADAVFDTNAAQGGQAGNAQVASGGVGGAGGQGGSDGPHGYSSTQCTPSGSAGDPGGPGGNGGPSGNGGNGGDGGDASGAAIYSSGGAPAIAASTQFGTGSSANAVAGGATDPGGPGQAPAGGAGGPGGAQWLCSGTANHGAHGASGGMGVNGQPGGPGHAAAGDVGQANSLSVADADVPEPAAGTAIVTFNVTLAHPAAGTITVHWGTADGAGSHGASAPGDYLSAGGDLTFTSGETSKSVAVTVNAAGPEATKTFSVLLSKPQGAALERPQATGTIRGISPLRVTLSATPQQILIKQTEDGPVPVNATVTVDVTNISHETIDHVTLPDHLTAGWHFPASGSKLPIRELPPPHGQQPPDRDLGSLAPGHDATGEYKVVVEGDGSLDLQALVLGDDAGEGISGFGTTLFEPDSQLLMMSEELGKVIRSPTHPPLLKAGASFLVNVTLENRSYYRRLLVDFNEPADPKLSGNAGGGNVQLASQGDTSATPSGSLDDARLSRAIEVDPQETEHMVVVVRTAGSDPFTDVRHAGGTQATVSFAPPTTEIVDVQDHLHPVGGDHLVLTGPQSIRVSLDDSSEPAPPFSKLEAAFYFTAGALWGLERATWGTVRGIFYDLPVAAVSAIPSVLTVPTYALDYVDHLVELWTACDSNPSCLTDLEHAVETQVAVAYPKYVLDTLVGWRQKLDDAMVEHFARLEHEWDAGEWRSALTEFTAESTDAGVNAALLIGPTVLARFPRAARVWEATKAASFAKVADVLDKVPALEKAAAAVRTLATVVRPGYEFTAGDVAKIFGVSGRENALLSALTKRLGISVVLRSRAAEAIKFLEEGLAVMKPYWIKTKNVSWLDAEYLGYLPEEVGKIVIRPPISIEKLEANLRAAGIGPGDAVWEEALARRATRAKEYVGEYREMQKWSKAQKVEGKWPWGDNGVNPELQADEYSTNGFRLVTENGGVVPQIHVPGEGWKFITGDIDLIAITKADGSALSDAEHVAVLKQLKTVLGTQHPESATWVHKGKFWFKAKRNYLLNDGECCLAQYAPDGKVRAVSFDEKLSNPGEWTKLKYRIFWKGGYQVGPGR